MSKNISKLSGRIGLKDNLFQKMSKISLSSKNGGSLNEIKEVAEKYHVGISTIHGAESFYEFLRPEHRAKKAFVCNGSACMCAGTQEPLKKKLQDTTTEQKVKDKVITQVLGIGINVNSNFQDLEPIQDKLYTSLLLELGKKVSREKLLKNLIETIDQTIQKQIHL